MAPQKYRKKPVVIDAVQWQGEWASIIAWLDSLAHEGRFSVPFGSNPPIVRIDDELHVTTMHGDPAVIRLGDWLIPEPTPNCFYPCNPDVFACTYEAVQA